MDEEHHAVDAPGALLLEPNRPRERSRSQSRHISLSLLHTKLGRLSAFSSRPNSADRSTTSSRKGPLGLNVLHEPSDPRIDFVFIHGLCGGSTKTWCYSEEPGLFWIKDWLPNEIGFRHVRIHSFGYNADWQARKSSHLTILDFAQALAADLYNSPQLRENGDTPIVLISHSMGGLVAKKAYLIATRDPTYQAVARRIHTMFFLATPHRGAQSAQLAKYVAQSTGYGQKSYLDDLIPGNRTLDQISEDFRHVCSDIRIWSFSEAVPTKFGITSRLVVDKQSATLGIPKEHVQYLEATHRNMCKFDSPVNSNYLILQRALLTTIEHASSENDFRFQNQYRSQMKQIASLLRVEHTSEAILLATNEQQLAGSCQWVTQDPIFTSWLQGCSSPEDLSRAHSAASSRSPKVLWLNGRPGTGKTVAAGHVIRSLQESNLDCSFYFFRAEDRASTTVATCLRSIAFQMAQSSYEVRRAIASMAEDEVNINHDDHHMLWTTLFAERILKVGHSRPQFLVIDALDECAPSGIPALVSMLSSLDSAIPIKFFITSRPGGALGRSLVAKGAEFLEITTGQEGSLKDIGLFLEARCISSGTDAQTHKSFVAEVLTKSNGIFLWASLTVARLAGAYSVEDKQEVLKEIPAEMDEFYTRIISTIAASPSAELARCVLKWAVCSPTPLSLDELAEAVKIDIGRTLTASARELETMTGHLLFVDKNSRIHVSHQTMAAFLTRQRDGLWIDEAAAHSRLAEITLTVLCGNDFSPPRIRRGGASPLKKRDISPLSDYAARHFSYHLIHCNSAMDGPLVMLDKFLRSNVLTWIERIATSGDLSGLQVASQRFQSYLRRRAKHQSSLISEAQTVSAWAVDIHHLVAAFHPSLLVSPSSIHSTIPYLCPPKSITAQLFGNPNRRIRVCGPVEDDWSDRLTCHLFQDEVTSVACGSRFHAIGLSSGEIKLYGSVKSGMFNCTHTLNHGKRVRQLSFDQSCSYLVSCSARRVCLWHLRPGGSSDVIQFWSRDISFTPSSVAFGPHGGNVVLMSPQQSALIPLRKEDGAELPPVLLRSPPDSDSSDESTTPLPVWTPAESIVLDLDHKLAALSYRNADINIWVLESNDFIGKFEREGFEGAYVSPPALDMVFNPIAEVELLAVAYSDGDVVTCNPWTLDQINTCHLPTSLVALTATSDGRVLAGAAEDGSIFLLLFETLQVIYQIEKPEDSFRVDDVVFFTDNLRFIDIRGQSCNVWEPSILVPKNDADDSSGLQTEELVLDEVLKTHAHVFRWGETITAIEPATSLGVVFVGRQNGAIDVCDLNTSNAVCNIRLHSNFAIIQCVSWVDDQKTLLSADSSGRCIVARIGQVQGRPKVDSHWAVQSGQPGQILQLLLREDSRAVLVCTRSVARLIEHDGQCVGETENSPEAWWAKHPTETSMLVQFKQDTAHIFDWQSLKKTNEGNGISVADLASGDPVKAAWLGRGASKYIVRYDPQTHNLSSLEASRIDIASETVPAQLLHAKSLNIQSVIGCLKSTMFYIDTKGWVCSVALKNLSETTQFIRHFLIPVMWRTGTEDCIAVVSKSVLAFGRGEQLLLFHGFLDVEEKASI